MLTIINTCLLVLDTIVILGFLYLVDKQMHKLKDVNETISRLRDFQQKGKLWIRHNGQICKGISINSLTNNNDLLVLIDTVDEIKK